MLWAPVEDFRLCILDCYFKCGLHEVCLVVGSDGEVSRVVGTLTDVTEIQERRRAACCTTSVHDNLTGLPNRKLFIDRLGAVGLLCEEQCRKWGGGK